MNPFITIIAVIVGEFLWGIPGMFLFIPVTGIIKLVCERVEGMEAWALLIGVDEKETLPVRKITFADND
jgi:predicted PurR-regulated permease PerM